jgi:succinate-semialdehyde dehydrogenase/glutarate-semialdehyde dehydrogenase
MSVQDMIDGPILGTASTFPVFDPATGLVIADVSDGTAVDASAAVDAAAAAFPGWAATAPRERAEILRRAYELMVVDRDRLTDLICSENGKPRADARAEVDYAAEFFRWFGEEAVRTEGGYGINPAGTAHTVVTHRPVGVAALVTPWNFPAAMATRKIGPALAAGCTVVLKPAAETPLTALAIAELLSEAGVPDGVVNVVPTTDPGAVVGTWLADSRVRKISFTGSTGVGRLLLRQAADRVVNASMELGGNAPFVVAADADIDAAVAGAMIAKFRGSGQACTAANRFYVHQTVAEEFANKLAVQMGALRVGAGAAEDTQLGPMVSQKAVDGITDKVDRSVAAGAEIVIGGRPSGGRGYFYPATVLTEVPRDSAVATEEIFGPVAPIITVRDDADALALANDSEFGLAGYIYTRDLARGLRVSEKLEVGMIGLNRGLVSDPAAPFGGVKQSGIGREGSYEGIDAYLETTYVATSW